MDEEQKRNNIRHPRRKGIPDVSYSSPMLEPGSRFGKFQIEQQLGRGGGGIVYLARDTKLDRPVAIKSIAPEIMSYPQVLGRWKREARLLASLNHPNIAAIYEELEESEGVSYLVLEYVPGDTLSDRIAQGNLDQKEAISIALQIADALAASHAQGVIHRDLKPGNIKITPEGRVKLLDFGIGKTVAGQGKEANVTMATHPGQVIGTPGYMSPEQTLGKETDTRSDIWSFGCVLYEMVAGKRPFPGRDTSDILESMLKADPNWDVIPDDVRIPLRHVIRTCLERTPEQRYQSATELHQELSDHLDMSISHAPATFNMMQVLRGLRRPATIVPTVLVVAVICATAFWLTNRNAGVTWAKTEAIPEIGRLADQGHYLAAFKLARQAEKHIPADPVLVGLWPRISHKKSIATEPPGARIYYAEYPGVAGDWKYLGQSPLDKVRFPRGSYRLRFWKEGYEERELATARTWGSWNIRLSPKDPATAGMVKCIGQLWGRIAYLEYRSAPETPAFFVDKYEVTNAKFKAFLDQGGYEKQTYWKHAFRQNGRELPWEEAIGNFKDKTGRTGPATWEGGTYPDGEAEFPVSGISWYEANAYAAFVGKALPTVAHWSSVASTGEASSIAPYSNFSGKGPVQIGTHRGMGLMGLYDAAGNVKEWCYNAIDDSEQMRYILGGDWTEPDYMFLHADIKSPWDRSSTNGLRCVKYVGGREAVPASLFQPPKRSITDFASFKPVSDEMFQVYRGMYSYDRGPLNAVVEDVNDSLSSYYRRERITFDAAYGDERVIAYLFLPKGIEPPYQTVLYFPGSNAIRMSSSKNLRLWELDKSIVQSGRAFVYPIYKGTYERRTNRTSDVPDDTVLYRDWVIQLTKDLRRTIDYLETRNDVHIDKLAYMGLSWGGTMGPVMLALEERFKLGIIYLGGTHGSRTLPEVNEFNFTPRVKVPILMVNGKLDAIFPVELSQKPFFNSLGTPPAHKKHVLYPGGHGIISTATPQVQADILNWLDRYLGVVE